MLTPEQVIDQSDWLTQHPDLADAIEAGRHAYHAIYCDNITTDECAGVALNQFGDRDVAAAVIRAVLPFLPAQATEQP
jgi:hypothetical protein